MSDQQIEIFETADDADKVWRDIPLPKLNDLNWGIQIDADGMEKQLDELNTRWHQYVQADPAVHMEDKSEDNELHRNLAADKASRHHTGF